ncbi:MAG: HAD family hydrolase [Bacteroidales bacterium]|nr:HAD family hydrolase [Bacteroidales bacterium]
MYAIEKEIKLEKINTIVWDWNGTLLNDAEVCLGAVNTMLVARGLQRISINHYKDIFTFPVKNYYEQIGFNFGKEDITDLSNEYLGHYFEHFSKTSLQDKAIQAIKFLKHEGKLQYILSAMSEDDLADTLYKKGIKHYFRKVYGIVDKLANGKLTVGQELLQKERLDPETTLMIGDTLHDYEVANALGMSVILLANGHQSHARLLKSDAVVLNDIGELIDYLCG